MAAIPSLVLFVDVEGVRASVALTKQETLDTDAEKLWRDTDNR